jgi:hypothetical protein
MITPPGGRPLSPRVTRHFEFTRTQAQLIAIAYHTLIPVVARPLERPRSRCGRNQPAAAAPHDLRTTAGGV